MFLCSGIVFVVVVYFKFVLLYYKFCKFDGICFGICYVVVLVIVEWMRMKGVNGNVFVRFDVGGVYVILLYG